ncbi:ABC transporter related protein [Allomeiothermus silvanus DSM 9946]|uniref:ABC transporter related protein n=2 Tax=Allomeiothermus silvanus TaxID=52022 RepID=D7BHU6_ALLS1|nr:heme ABC transporter ATP-binding protein [Allomeiothermus silvanus]ADH64036.1 ABC transporter related protein [Allomeiothermus silvanus DSM 9946]
MLEARTLSFRVGQRRLLGGVSFGLEAGEVLGVLGPNGAGKSTLLRLLSGEERPTSGEVRLLGKPMAAYTAAELALLRSVLTQRRDLSFPFTAYEVAFLGRLPHLERRLEHPRDHQATAHALGLAQAQALSHRKYSTLSGGEQSRVDLARVLAQEPRLLLLDEPTNHLDPRHQVEVLQLCRRLAREGRAVVAVLHDINLAALFCDRVLLLHQGTAVALGTPQEVLEPERLERVYGLPFALTRHPSGRPWVMPLG